MTIRSRKTLVSTTEQPKPSNTVYKRPNRPNRQRIAVNAKTDTNPALSKITPNVAEEIRTHLNDMCATLLQSYQDR